MHASLFNYLSIYLSNLVLTPAALQILLERGIINNKTSREVKISLVSVSLFYYACIHTYRRRQTCKIFCWYSIQKTHTLTFMTWLDSWETLLRRKKEEKKNSKMWCLVGEEVECPFLVPDLIYLSTCSGDKIRNTMQQRNVVTTIYFFLTKSERDVIWIFLLCLLFRLHEIASLSFSKCISKSVWKQGIQYVMITTRLDRNMARIKYKDKAVKQN